MIGSALFKKKFYFFPLPTSFNKRKYHCFTHHVENTKYKHTLSDTLKMFNPCLYPLLSFRSVQRILQVRLYLRFLTYQNQGIPDKE